ncbi:ATP-binding protein [Planococcus sp. ISL-109]|uniref:ATP-binding protein n=1 Tax=Planococcus sp. ISL-109 TaxID=2819166 RepID=UPI001BEAB171|nr:ATP-binding protein [Planococcus sp. ISL-109]MBT2583177.1 ATP-binding protein [Planococcus sp. ISL-109]
MAKEYNGRLVDIALASSTSKIKKEFDSIFEGSEEENNKTRRRWIWELIQNASDCTPKGSTININLEIDDNRITFSHDGIPFTYNNLQDLITQVSTKEESGEDLTGKFGTGFMSTFLLSNVVEIEGTFIRNNKTATNMKFTINRTKRDYNGIKEQTIQMLDELEELDRSSNEVLTSNKTKFIYDIKGNNQDSKQAVKQGGKDLLATIPYLLAFNETIQSVNYNGKRFEKAQSKTYPTYNNLTHIQIKTIDESNINIESLFCFSKNNVLIACPVEHDKGSNLIFFKPLSDNIPKLFCDFPLIGTEDFAFPIIINSALFGVTEDRDAIRDGNQQNRDLLEEAISLYKNLIDVCSNNTFTRNEFNICIFEKRQYTGLQEHCYDQIFKYISRSPLIRINKPKANYERKSYLNEAGDIQVYIPKTRKEENSTIFWKIFSEGIYLNTSTEETFLGWKKVFGGNYHLKLVNKLFEDKTITDFNSTFVNEREACEWLDKFYSLWIDDEGIEEVIKSVFVPTQHKSFNHIKSVYYDDDIREDIKGILFELKPSWEKKLLNQCIGSFKNYFSEDSSERVNTEQAAKLIDNNVNKILVDETSENLDRTKELQVIFNKLNDFFLQEKDLSEKYFPKVFPKRMLVSSTKETLRRMAIAEKVERNGIDLDEYLSNHQKIKDILESSDLGTEEIRTLLKHIVTSTPEMREYFASLLLRSVENVYRNLKESKKYFVPETLEEWKGRSYSETIFPAKKEEKEIIIVIRPTDNNQIIFYGEEELEVLDSGNYELWTDNGEDDGCKEITLGELLKTTGITRIPLKKL